MEIGERIYVEAFLFSGHATVTYIAPAKDREIYPIQIELDEPDENGHKTFRVCQDNIKEAPQEPTENPGEIVGDFIYYHSEDPESDPVIVPIKRKLQRFMAQVNRKRMGFILGERYIVSEKNDNGYYHVYLANKPDDGPIGSYCSNFFKIGKPYTEKVEDVPIIAPEPAEIKAIEPEPTNTPAEVKKPAKRKKTGNIDDQFTIYDFMGGLA